MLSADASGGAACASLGTDTARGLGQVPYTALELKTRERHQAETRVGTQSFYILRRRGAYERTGRTVVGCIGSSAVSALFRNLVRARLLNLLSRVQCAHTLVKLHRQIIIHVFEFVFVYIISSKPGK